MTAQQSPSAGARPACIELSARAAAALLASAAPPVVVDARAPASYALERIRGALSSPPATALSGRTALFYDAGASSLSQTFSLAATSIARYVPLVAPGTRLALVAGGLPALRSAAPHLLIVDADASRALRRRVAGMPWALRLLDQVANEAAPPGRVLPWLFVGAAAHAYDAVALAARGFTHVVVVGGELKARFPDRFRYLHVRARDTSTYPLKSHFADIVAFLHRLGCRVARGERLKCLVHCFAGASRSVAAVVAYLVWKGMPAGDALAFVKERRKAAEPNDGFLRQIVEWEDEVRQGLHRDLAIGDDDVLLPDGPVTEDANVYQDDDDEDESDDDDDDVDDNCNRVDDEQGHRREPNMRRRLLRGRVVEEEPLALAAERPKRTISIPRTPKYFRHQDMQFDFALLPSPITPQHMRQDHPESTSIKSDQPPKTAVRHVPPATLSLTRPFHLHNMSADAHSSCSTPLTSSSSPLQQTWTSDLSDIEQGDQEMFMDVAADDSTDSTDC